MCLKGWHRLTKRHTLRENLQISKHWEVSAGFRILIRAGERQLCIWEIWEMPKPLVKRKLGLSCCGDLSLQFPIPPTDSSSVCVNSSAPWNDSRADNETTLCVLTCTITQRTEEILQGTWETKTNTSYRWCKLCLDNFFFSSKPMKRFMSRAGSKIPKVAVTSAALLFISFSRQRFASHTTKNHISQLPNQCLTNLQRMIQCVRNTRGGNTAQCYCRNDGE